MKNLKLFTICLFLSSALFTISCDVVQSGGNYKSFSSDLLGTWNSNEPNGLYTGTLIITYDTITIDGYGENWLTLLSGNESQRPFSGYPRGLSKGYSEEGKIFIDNSAQGIPYTYTEGSYPKYKRLEFTFGGRKEFLDWTAEP
jgi:hypothetical protein